MTDNVIRLVPPEDEQPNPEVIALCKALLEAAEKGEITAMIAVGCSKENASRWRSSEWYFDELRLIGLMEREKFDLMERYEGQFLCTSPSIPLPGATPPRRTIV